MGRVLKEIVDFINEKSPDPKADKIRLNIMVGRDVTSHPENIKENEELIQKVKDAIDKIVKSWIRR